MMQGKWVCVMPKYKNHSFFVKGSYFYQYLKNEIVEQRLPYHLEHGDDDEVTVFGLFLDCDYCYGGGEIIEVSPSKLVLMKSDLEGNDEEIIYKKVVSIKTKKK